MPGTAPTHAAECGSSRHIVRIMRCAQMLAVLVTVVGATCGVRSRRSTYFLFISPITLSACAWTLATVSPAAGPETDRHAVDPTPARPCVVYF